MSINPVDFLTHNMVSPRPIAVRVSYHSHYTYRLELF